MQLIQIHSNFYLIKCEEPNAVESLIIYSVDETSLGVSWLPPKVGHFLHFVVEVKALDGNLVESQKVSVNLSNVLLSKMQGNSLGKIGCCAMMN